MHQLHVFSLHLLISIRSLFVSLTFTSLLFSANFHLSWKVGEYFGKLSVKFMRQKATLREASLEVEMPHQISSSTCSRGLFNHKSGFLPPSSCTVERNNQSSFIKSEGKKKKNSWLAGVSKTEQRKAGIASLLLNALLLHYSPNTKMGIQKLRFDNRGLNFWDREYMENTCIPTYRD